MEGVMPPTESKERFKSEPARVIEEEIKSFAQTSPQNRLTMFDNVIMFDEPLVQFADGDDPIFAEYKTIIDPSHLTPREALAKACGKSLKDMPARLSVISWILPITSAIRKSNHKETRLPSTLWSHTRWYGEKFNDAMREHVTGILGEMGYRAAAPMLQPYFDSKRYNEKGRFSNWSERHIAYAAGLGTFSISDGFITERGIAHRCGSVATELVLPASPRTAKSPYANCLLHINRKCRACIERCPAGAVTEEGHDKLKCQEYLNTETRHIRERYNLGVAGCGLCQTKVPCESRNPAKKLSKKTE